MAWERRGTINLTQGSKTVMGVGTEWLDVHRGWILITAPDGRLYEITKIISTTEIELADEILASTGSGLSYAIIPTHSLAADLALEVRQLTTLFGGAATDLSLTTFQIWLNNGNTGTVGDFLEAMRGPKGDKGDSGDPGWVPELASVVDGDRRVWQIVDWSGGTGTKPATGDYVGSTGFVSDIAQATDHKGGKGDQGDSGAQGDAGWSPVFAIQNDGARRVLQVIDWVGGAGTKPATGTYVAATGLVADIASAIDLRGPQGTPGAAGAGSGDMLVANYDPTGVNDDAFDRANHTGTQPHNTITGLGSAATTASTDYATAAQGAKADSAIQQTDLDAAIAGVSGGNTAVVPVSGAAPVLDLSAGAVFKQSLTGNASYSVSNVPADAWTRTLLITADGAHALTFPANWNWGGAGLPDAFGPQGGTLEIALRAEGSGDVRAALLWFEKPEPPAYAFWRVTVTKNPAGAQYLQVKDLEFRAAVGGADLTTPGDLTPAFATVNNGNAGYAFDNTTNSKWLVQTGTESVGWEFNQPEMINEIYIVTNTDHLSGQVVIEASSDGTTWTEQWSAAAPAGSTATITRPGASS